MQAKNKQLIFLFFFLFGGILWAQERSVAKVPPKDAILSYISETKEYAALFNGKIETPYDRQFINHPYLETDQYIQGTLCYNEVVYHDILMRLDLNRDELAVFSPDKHYRIVLEIEKFNYAVLNGFTIITSTNESNTGTKYMLLLKDGIYPLVKQFKFTVKEEIQHLTLKRYFRFQEQYFITVDGIIYPVKNKKAILKLFPDRKKELNDFAKQQKLSFRAQQFEQSMVALVKQCEKNPK